MDKKIISKDILYGSWAGAFGNFQFMPRTIRNYAIDYNKNNTIELKNIEGRSHKEIADYLDISVTAAKVRLHRAHQKLRQILEEVER